MCDEINGVCADITAKLSKLSAEVDECLDRVAAVEKYRESFNRANNDYIYSSAKLDRATELLTRRLAGIEEMLLRDKPSVRFAKALIELDRHIIDNTCILCGADFSMRTSHNTGCAIADAETYLNTNVSDADDD